MEQKNKTKKECLLRFHGNFIKETGPMESGATRVTFDIPEMFDGELTGIRTLLKGKNLIIYIFEDDMDKNYN